MFQICRPQPTRSSTCSRRAQRSARVPRRTDPDDRIPDRIPGVGNLDDASMAKFVARVLTHEIAAYEAFRENHKTRPKTDEPARLEARRDALQARMRRRRRHERSRQRSRGSSSSSRIRLW